METDPDQLPDEGTDGGADPDVDRGGAPTPEEQRRAPDGEGGTSAPIPGNPDVGGS